MATKTISIMEDVYETLKVLKAPEESFSEEIRRLATTKGSIMDLAGAWKDMDEKDFTRIRERIKDRRRDDHRLAEIRRKI